MLDDGRSRSEAGLPDWAGVIGPQSGNPAEVTQTRSAPTTTTQLLHKSHILKVSDAKNKEIVHSTRHVEPKLNVGNVF